MELSASRLGLPGFSNFRVGERVFLKDVLFVIDQTDGHKNFIRLRTANTAECQQELNKMVKPQTITLTPTPAYSEIEQENDQDTQPENQSENVDIPKNKKKGRPRKS